MEIAVIVKGQIINRSTTIENIVAGSMEYHKVKFIFDTDWDGLTKTVQFQNGDTVVNILLYESDNCIIPHEVIDIPGNLNIYVYGSANTKVITTAELNKLIPVIQNGSKDGGTTPVDPTPDIYTQITDILITEANIAEVAANNAKDEADRSKSEADRSNESALVSIEKEYLTSQDYEGTTSDRQIVADSKRDVLDAKEVVLQTKNELLNQKGQANGVATLDSLGKVNETAKDSEKLGGQLPIYYTPASNFNSLIETVNSKIENLTVDNENGAIKTYKNGIESSTSITGLISGAFHDPTTGKLTLTVKGSQNIVVDIGKDKFCESGYFDASTNEIVFVMNDGSEIRFDVQHLIDIYVGGDTSSVRVTVNGYAIFADVLISSDENNRLEEREDGLYVSPTDLSAYCTKNENDLLYLGINGKANDSSKLNNKTEGQLSVDSAIKADKLSSSKTITFNGVASGQLQTDFSNSEYSVTLAHNIIPWTVVTPVGDAVTIDAQQDDMIVMTNSNPVQLTINNLSSGAILIVRIYSNTLDEEYLNDTYGIVIPDYCKYIVATNVDQAYEYIIESDGVKTTATRSVVV